MEISGANDCSEPDSSGHALVRKVGKVDSAHPFQISTYDDCGQQFDADKDEHAQMLLELRWDDDAKAKAGAPDTLGPMLHIKFSTVWGEFFAAPVTMQVSALHPEENGQGFNYLYAFVNQAAKNESSNGISYNISVRVDSGASPIRATGRIYYKKYGTIAKRDAGSANGVRDTAVVSTLDAAGSDARRDAAVVTGLDSGSDARQDAPASGGPDAGADVRPDAASGDVALVVPDAAAMDAPKDGLVAIDGVQGSAGVDGAGAPPVTTANLILNGDAEQGVGASDGAPVAVPGWTATGGATLVPYGGTAGYPLLTDPGPQNRGLNFFCGGMADASSVLTQAISLSAYATTIDSGTSTFALQGYLGGYGGQDDNATLSVSFLNAGGTALGSSSIGPVLSADRSGATGLLLRSTTGKVPAGARAATVTLTLTRVSGTANDGYADGLSLVLSGT
jgi:hypothetical protein